MLHPARQELHGSLAREADTGSRVSAKLPSVKLWAISDLHLDNRLTRSLLLELPDHGDDWLILAGDIAEREENLCFAFDELKKRFAQLIWVPGNHELWTVGGRTDKGAKGVARYEHLVELARARGVLTPEDPYPRWPGAPTPHRVVPMFLLYDYSYHPEESTPRAEAVAWAGRGGVLCADERYLSPEPYASREAWCRARVDSTRARLDEELDEGEPTILVNHWPLRRDLAMLPAIPRFCIWCGTRATEDWAHRYGATAVVYGHLHIRRTHHRHHVRFEEVSLGYPRQYERERGLAPYLREILPGRSGAPLLRRYG